MESKLNSYRKGKRRQALLNVFKERIYNMVSFQQVRVDEKSSHVIVVADNDSPPDETPQTGKTLPKMHSKPVYASAITNRTDSEEDFTDNLFETTETPEADEQPRTFITYVTYLIYFLFWATLYAIAIELRFGVVFLMLSALLGIYFNTRTKKAPGEISAYSVFNKNCEAIDGTLKAEQFEREIGIRH